MKRTRRKVLGEVTAPSGAKAPVMSKAVAEVLDAQASEMERLRNELALEHRRRVKVERRVAAMDRHWWTRLGMNLGLMRLEVGHGSHLEPGPHQSPVARS